MVFIAFADTHLTSRPCPCPYPFAQPDAWVEAKRCNSRLDSDFSIRDSFAHTELAGLNYEAIQSTLSNRERGHSFVDDLQDLTRSQPAQTGVSPHDATGQGSCSVDASC